MDDRPPAQHNWRWNKNTCVPLSDGRLSPIIRLCHSPQPLTTVFMRFLPRNSSSDLVFPFLPFLNHDQLGKAECCSLDRFLFFFPCINLAGEDICNFTAVSSIFLLGFSLFIALGSGLRLIFMCPPLFILLPQHRLFRHWLNILLTCECLWPSCWWRESFYCKTFKTATWRLLI